MSRAGRARHITDARRDRLEYRVKVLHHIILAADHHAVTALQTPNAAAGSHIDIVNSLLGEILGAPNIVDVVRVAAVDQDVVFLQMWNDLGDRIVHRCRRNHQPDGARLGELFHHVRQPRRAHRLVLLQFLHRLR